MYPQTWRGIPMRELGYYWPDVQERYISGRGVCCAKVCDMDIWYFPFYALTQSVKKNDLIFYIIIPLCRKYKLVMGSFQYKKANLPGIAIPIIKLRWSSLKWELDLIAGTFDI